MYRIYSLSAFADNESFSCFRYAWWLSTNYRKRKYSMSSTADVQQRPFFSMNKRFVMQSFSFDKRKVNKTSSEQWFRFPTRASRSVMRMNRDSPLMCPHRWSPVQVLGKRRYMIPSVGLVVHSGDDTMNNVCHLFFLGVVYISPLTGDHYPAFIHVYRCDTSRTAQKLLSRLRAYLLIERHRLQLVKLEQDLLDRRLLNIAVFNAIKSQTSNITRPVSSSPSPPVSTSSDDRPVEKKFDPLKSVNEEFQRKISSQEPLLFPPKDYDTLHVSHGNVHRAHGWKSTEVRSSFDREGHVTFAHQLITHSLTRERERDRCWR